MDSRLFDPGLQPERTELAWRRTALSIAIGSLVSMRLLPVFFDDAVWVVPGCIGIVASAALWVGAARRFRRINRSLLAGRGMRGEGGGPLAIFAGLTAALGLFAGAVVVWAAV